MKNIENIKNEHNIEITEDIEIISNDDGTFSIKKNGEFVSAWLPRDICSNWRFAEAQLMPNKNTKIKYNANYFTYIHDTKKFYDEKNEVVSYYSTHQFSDLEIKEDGILYFKSIFRSYTVNWCFGNDDKYATQVMVTTCHKILVNDEVNKKFIISSEIKDINSEIKQYKEKIEDLEKALEEKKSKQY